MEWQVTNSHDIENVLYIPHCPVNLLSVNAAAHSHHCTITFDKTSCTAMQASSVLWSFPASSDGVKFASRPCECSELCTVSEHDFSPAFSLAVTDYGRILIPTTIEWLWHRRLGHSGYQAMPQLVNGNMVKNLPLTHKQVKLLENIPCDACHKAKAKRLPFPKASTTKVHAPLQHLHLDLMGPFSC